MSDLDEILGIIASLFAALVILLIVLTWLEATLSKDYIAWGRRAWFPPAASGQDGGPGPFSYRRLRLPPETNWLVLLDRAQETGAAGAPGYD
jgi:hypothetical protein